MHTKSIGLAITALLAPAVFGQTQAPLQYGEFHFTRIGTVQNFREVANGVRLITEIADISVDDSQMSLIVRGKTEQVGLAGWLVAQLDQPPAGAISPAPLEYQGLSGTDGKGHAVNEIARVFYLPHAATVQDFQEAVNATYTITEIRRVFAYNDRRAVLARGTPEQMAAAEWMLHELDQATVAQASSQPGQTSGAHEYSIGKDDVMRVFYLANAKTVQDFQEIANATRTVTKIRRAFTYNTPRAMAIRGTPNELAMSAWLLAELDKPSDARQSQASGEYHAPGAADDVMRVFYAVNAKSVQDFQALAMAVRSAAEIGRVFTNNARHALVIRGTANQLALVGSLIHDLDASSR